MGLLDDYSRQAQRYDETRAASPSALRCLGKGLAGAPGPRLADIGGGTGNYAAALAADGWQPVVADRSAAMLERAAVKGLETVEAVLMGYAREDSDSLWVLDYFPSSREWMAATHPPRTEMLALLPGATSIDFAYEDIEDASLAALSGDPARVVEAAETGATSFFERMTRDHPDELAKGIERLRADIAAGRAPSRPGTATVLSWTRPGERAAAG